MVTSTELIDLTDLPPRLLVVGAGSIGLELATTYATFGSTVTVVDAVPDLLPSMDRDVADLVASVLADSASTSSSALPSTRSRTPGRPPSST